jgi:hypothetical protein
MKERLVDVRLGGDLLHPRPGRPATNEDLSRCLQDALFGIGVRLYRAGVSPFIRHFN